MPAPGTAWGPSTWVATAWAANTWVTTNTAPHAVFSVSGTGLARTFDSSASWDDVGIVLRGWDFGDGQIAGNLTTVSHVYLLGGSYTVSLTVTDGSGATNTLSSLVTVDGPVSTVITPVVLAAPTGSSLTVSLSEIHIWNLALTHLGNSTEVQSITENSAEANACRRCYAQVRDEMLDEYPWPFAKVVAPLAVVATAPTTEWAYAYRYPVDCMTFRRILGTTRNDTRQSRVPYLLGHDAEGELIYTDWPNAVGEYTQSITDPTQFSPLFTRALAYKLACEIGPRITGGDPYNLVSKCEVKYREAMLCAANDDANEEQPEELPESEFIRARDGATFTMRKAP